MTLTVDLPKDTMLKLKELASRYNMTPEELVRASVEELIASPEETFLEAVDYALKKNQELYKRLAV
jgi:predicted transcriptional regulator